MTESRKLRVFLCYAPEDKPLMREMYDRLDSEKWIEPWLDEEKLAPGMDWETEVEKAVGASDSIIVCISKNAIIENKYVRRELRFVLNLALENAHRSIFIIPLRLDGCQIPRHIQPWQYYDFSVLDQREQVYQKMVRNLKIRASIDPNVNAPKQYAHFLYPTEQPIKYSYSPDILEDLNLIEIPRGKFLMGSRVANPWAIEDEFPQHPCYIPYNYSITRFPITNEQFGEFSVFNKRTDCLLVNWRSKPHQPAVNVSWHQAVTYVNWLNKVFGKELEHGFIFRLPTEAEWERAARGDAGREWPWGNEDLDQTIERELSSIANQAANETEADDFLGSTDVSDFYAKVFRFNMRDFYKMYGLSDADLHWRYKSRQNYTELKKKIAALRSKPDLTDVGSFSPLTDSHFKVADMMGNIMEWTQSLYEPYPYSADDGRENLGGDGKRVIRGLFSPGNERFSVRCAKRFAASPNEKYYLLGFRIVIAPAV